VLALRGQIAWPFGWLPSFEAASEDPDILHEVVMAGVAAGLGLVLLVAATILVRRARGLALLNALAGAAALVWASPHLQPLFVPAVPTIFYNSPTGFSAASILAGEKLFGPNCAVCHGAQGRGDGPAADKLPVPPANLTQAHLWMHPDGQMFWWLSHGMEGPDGTRVMPGFPQLDEASRWALIDYIRGHNAGLTLADGHWGTQVLAPDVLIACTQGETHLADLRGHTVRVILSPDAVALPGVVSVALGEASPTPGLCRIREADAQAAFAVVAPGAGAMLVDADGWLRQAATSADGLSGAVAAIAAAPLPVERPATVMDAAMQMRMNQPMGTAPLKMAPARMPPMQMPPPPVTAPGTSSGTSMKMGGPDDTKMKDGTKM
jgi:mono/diheme cytochrome c family protein